MKMTMSQKILAAHANLKEVKAGQIVSIDVDVEKDQHMAVWIMSHGYVEYAAVAKELRQYYQLVAEETV